MGAATQPFHNIENHAQNAAGGLRSQSEFTVPQVNVKALKDSLKQSLAAMHGDAVAAAGAALPASTELNFQEVSEEGTPIDNQR